MCVTDTVYEQGVLLVFQVRHAKFAKQCILIDNYNL